MKTRLFFMMFLEFFIWGAWLPLIFGYLPLLDFSAGQQSLILNAFPIASLLGMFFSNQFADRNFAAERFLAFSHLVGGLAMLGLGFVTDFWTFFVLMSIHCVLYVPTISITNTVAFANMKDAQAEFGVVRLGGTIGWIAASLPFTFIFVDWKLVEAANAQGFVNWLGTVLGSGLQEDALRDATKYTYIVAGIASLLLAGYSLTLPHTPPKPASGDGSQSLAFVEALKLLKHPFVLVLWIVAFLDSFVHNCYFNWTGQFLQSAAVGVPGNWVMPVMSIGQVAEILTMLVLGVALRTLGWRTTMIVGVLGHALRFAIYTWYPDKGTIIAIQVVHGICYAFFFATVYIFVDEYFPKDVRTSAQGLFNVMILGFGALAANTLCPWLLERSTTTTASIVDNVEVQKKVINFSELFQVPLAASVIAAVALAVLFHPPKKAATAAGTAAAAH